MSAKKVLLAGLAFFASHLVGNVVHGVTTDFMGTSSSLVVTLDPVNSYQVQFTSAQIGEYSPSTTTTTWLSLPFHDFSLDPTLVSWHNATGIKVRTSSMRRGVSVGDGVVHPPPVADNDVEMTWNITHFLYVGQPNFTTKYNWPTFPGAVEIKINVKGFTPGNLFSNMFAFKFQFARNGGNPVMASLAPDAPVLRLMLNDRLYVDVPKQLPDYMSSPRNVQLDILPGDANYIECVVLIPMQSGEMSLDLLVGSLALDPTNGLFVPPAPTMTTSSIANTGTYGKVNFCFDGLDCGALARLDLQLHQLAEFDSGTDALALNVKNFAASTAYNFMVQNVGSATSPFGTISRANFDVAIPLDGIREPYVFPRSGGDAHFAMSIQHFNVVGGDQLGGHFHEPVFPGSFQVVFTIGDWVPVNSANYLRLEINVAKIGSMSLRQESDPAPDVKRFSFGDDRFWDVPVRAINPHTLADVAVAVSATDAGADFVFRFDFRTIEPTIQYTTLVSSTTLDHTPPLSSLSAPPTPSPTPSPSLAPTPAMLTSGPPTRFNTYPELGMVEICFSLDCNSQDPSLSIAMDRVGSGATIDFSTHQIAFTTELANFDTVAIVDADLDGHVDPWVTPITVDSSSNGDPAYVSATIFAMTCATGCAARSSNDFEFAGVVDDTDGIGIKVEAHHVWKNATIDGGYEDYPLLQGGLGLNISINVAPPTGAISFSIPNFGLSFFAMAFENDAPTTNVTLEPYVGGNMYLTRVHIGQEMFLDLPTYATVDGIPMMITVGAAGHISGEYRDLVEVSMVFSQVATSVRYELGVSSSDMTGDTDLGAIASSGSTLQEMYGQDLSKPVTSSDGRAVASRMITLPRGQFALCLNANCTSSGVQMGFSGLGSTEGVSLKRFDDSAAFTFATPEKATIDGTDIETLSSSFRAWVPQSRQRPPIAYDATLEGAHANEPIFGANVDQFLASGVVPFGSEPLTIPRGAVKFSITITSWVFASSTDSLVLNMSLTSLTGTMDQVANVSSLTKKIGATLLQVTLDEGKTIELPRFAMLDNVQREIDVDVVEDPLTGLLVVCMKFPAFSHHLYYDPVLSSSTIQEAALASGRTLKKLNKGVSWAVAGPLLGFLGLVILVSILQCIKKVKAPKLDFTKVIP